MKTKKIKRKTQLLNELKKSVEEVLMAKKGRMKLQSARDFLKEL